jgi:WD40 repeat protein
VALSPDGKFLATSSSVSRDRLVRLWDPRTGKLLRELRGHKDGVVSVAFLDNRTLLSTGRDSDRAVRFWDISTTTERQLEGGRPMSRLPLVLSPDGKFLAGTEEGGGPEKSRALVWDVTGKPRRKLPWQSLSMRLEGQSGPITSLAFYPDNHHLAVAEPEGVAFWNLESGERGHTLSALKEAEHLAFTRDGWLLAGVEGRMLV